MKKLTTALAVAALAALTALPLRADIQLGIKAGGTMTRPTGLQALDPAASLKSKSGFTGGIFLALNYGRVVTVQWEAVYSMKGAVYSPPGSAVTETLSADYIEVPLLLKLRAPLPVIQPFVFAGPTVGFKLQENLKTDGEETDVEAPLLKNNDYGAVFGAGLNLGPNFMFDVRYSQGLQKVVSAVAAGLPPGFKNGVWSMSLGLVF
jgi:hypothetical protein